MTRWLVFPLLGLPLLAWAADPHSPPPDPEFMEFLCGDDVDPELAKYLGKPEQTKPSVPATPPPPRGRTP